MEIIDELRKQTRQTHTELDHAVFPLIQQIRTTDDYARMLRTFYGFFQPLYDQFDQWLNDSVVSDYSRRRKPEWIIQDLQAIGATGTALPVCNNVPTITSQPEAFGAFYVLEGSTMGGTIISKKISENLNLNPGVGFRFFSGYGENNRKMWNDFITSMEAREENQKCLNSLIDLSQKTFHLFNEWITLQYAQTHQQSKSRTTS